MALSLGPHFDAFVAEQVSAGRYATADDVLRAGLRLLERIEDPHAQAFWDAVAEGEESGYIEVTDHEAFCESVRRRRPGEQAA